MKLPKNKKRTWVSIVDGIDHFQTLIFEGNPTHSGRYFFGKNFYQKQKSQEKKYQLTA